MAIWKRTNSSETTPDDVRMTLGEHLEELRTRLIRAIVALMVGAVLCYIVSDYVMAVLTWPVFAVMKAHDMEPVIGFFNPPEAFILFLKVSLIVGFIVSAPYSLAQVWGFVASGLYPQERLWVRRFVPVSIALFFTGALFLLLVVSPLLVDFLLTYQTELPNMDKYMPNMPGWLLKSAGDDVRHDHVDELWPTSQPIAVFHKDPESPPQATPWINLETRDMRIRIDDKTYAISHLKVVKDSYRIEPNIRISEYVMFILHLAAAFGIGFQVPVIVAFLGATGIAQAKQMAQLRRYVWFGMAIMASFITPPDISSMLFLLVPMALLYEVGLVAARMFERRRANQES
jgi:sec-independent protein translocase protein TatC